MAAQGTRDQFGLVHIWREIAQVRPMSAGSVFWQLVQRALTGMLRAPVPALVSLVTMAGALTIVGLSLLVGSNVGNIVQASAAQVHATVLLKDGTDQSAIEALRRELANLPFVREITFRDRFQALEDFGHTLGASQELLDGLRDDNPLPDSLEVRFAHDLLSQENLFLLKETAKKSPRTDEVLSSDVAVGQLATLMTWGKQLGAALVGLIIAVALVLVMTNVTLSLYAHREEIEIMRLVGAKEVYVQGPFLIEGALIGTLGAILAIAVLGILGTSFTAMTKASQFMQLLSADVSFMSFGVMLLLVVAGLMVGMGGTFLALKRWRQA